MNLLVKIVLILLMHLNATKCNNVAKKCLKLSGSIECGEQFIIHGRVYNPDKNASIVLRGEFPW